MGTPGLQTAPDMGEPLKPLQYLPVGHRIPPPVRHGHLLPIRAMPANRRVHSPAVLPQVPDHHRLICPCQTVVLKLCGQCLVRSIILCRNNQSAGIPVNAVNNPRPQSAPYPAQALPAVVEQGVDQGPVRVPRRRVDHHPHRLIDHDDVLVLIDHIQGDVLGNQVDGLRVGEDRLQRLAFLACGIALILPRPLWANAAGLLAGGLLVLWNWSRRAINQKQKGETL